MVVPSASDRLTRGRPPLVSISPVSKAPVIEGTSYNKLVEKLLDFRSALAATETSHKENQEVDAAGTGPSVASGVVESEDGQPEDSGAQPEDSAHVAPTADEKGAGTGRAARADDAVADSGPLGEEEASQSTSADKEGSDSILHREGPSTAACAPTTSAAISDAESLKVAMTLKEGQVAEDFFNETASQLTYYGLSRLHQEVRGIVDCKYLDGKPRENPVGLATGWSPFVNISMLCMFVPSTGSRAPALRFLSQQPL